MFEHRTRQSYVAAVVKPGERTFAAGVTNLVRNGAWAAASAVAGVFMQQVAFAAPLLLGGGLKIIYDRTVVARFSASGAAGRTQSSG